MKNKVTSILFDYGGTLDTNGVHWSEKFWETYRLFKVPVEKDAFKNSFVYSERKIVNVIKTDFNLRRTIENQLFYQIEYLTNANLVSNQAYTYIEGMSEYCMQSVLENTEKAKSVLGTLKEKYTLGLISNYYGNVETVLEDTGIKKFFRVIIDSAAAGFRKPDRKIFELALEKLDVKPVETAVAGDSYGNDIVPAKELGCSTIWLKGKGWHEPEDTGSADVIITSLIQILEIL